MTSYLNKKVAASIQKTEINGRGDPYADHVTPLYPQKLALTSPTGDGRTVDIVRSRTKATKFFSLLFSATAITSRIISQKREISF